MRSPGLHSQGFTLVEQLIILVVLGILLAIAAPVWNGFLASRTLNIGQDQLYHAIRNAQNGAMQSNLRKEIVIREINQSVQWAITTVSFVPGAGDWQRLNADLRIDRAETTLPLQGTEYQVQFDHRGHVAGQLGRITLRHRLSDRLKRCVIVSTLLGTIRNGRERQRPDETGRYCY